MAWRDQIDDVLVYGKDQAEHNARLRLVLERISKANVTLNHEKCEFGKSWVKFLGHLVNQHRVSADPEKTTAISTSVSVRPETVSGHGQPAG